MSGRGKAEGDLIRAESVQFLRGSEQLCVHKVFVSRELVGFPPD